MQSTDGGVVDLKQQQQPHPQPPQSPQMYNYQPHQVHPHQQLWMQQCYQQQQWMAMQYPAAAMVMQQQQLLYPQQQQLYVPYHHLQAYQQPQLLSQPQILSSDDDNRTIWIGDLQQWMDETYLHSCFSITSEVSSVKIIRNKHTGHSEKYGFVEFTSHAAAEKVLQSFNGSHMPKCDQNFRLNWAAFSTGDKRGDAVGSDLSIFVGDLALDVDDALLLETFSSQYPSVKGAKVVVDTITGLSKGYGFVRFGDENERSRAISEMNGTYCSSRQMRVGMATPKRNPGHQQHNLSQSLSAGYAPNGAAHQNEQSDTDLVNTTIFVGGLGSDVTDEDLRQSFSQHGEIVSIKIPLRKGCGFVQFANRTDAEDAIHSLNGTMIGRQTVRLAWGRNLGNKQLKNGQVIEREVLNREA